MKKLLIIMMFFVQLILFATVFAEQGNEGIVHIINNWELPADADVPDFPNEVSPFIPENMDKAIFGTDNRITVYNPSSYPYSAIAYMDVVGKCGCSWSGTGFMTDKDRLLTAAHCLVCPNHGSWAKYIDFYFGYKNHKNYLYHYNGSWTAWAGNVFKNHSYTTDGDFGCVKLSKNVGNTVGWFGTRWGVSDKKLESMYLYVAGYRDGMIRYDSGWVKAKNSTIFTYDMDDVPGNSGGPVFDSDNYAVGIIIAENYLGGYNIGYRLTDNVHFNLYELN